MRPSGSRGNCAITPLEVVLALVAIGALTVTVLLDLPVHSSPLASSDLKTLYASAWCLRHGLDAYQFSNLQAVFQAQGVVPPSTWYGHAPVYPPMTVAVLMPITVLSMAHAAYVMTVVFALAVVWALCELLRYSEESFGLTLGWKAAVIALFAMSPLLAFGLSVGNPSIPAAALCIVAFARRGRGSMWVPAIALGAALLLKPHLAVWMLVALALLPDWRAGAVALRGGVAAVLVGATTMLALTRGRLWMQMASFLQVLRSEVAAGGSMNAGSHEPLFVASQITSLQSVLGFWNSTAIAVSAGVLLLAGMLAVLVWQTRKARGERNVLLVTGAWCAFGLMTTYHRAHDATVLLLLAPWVVDRLRRRPADWRGWLVLGLGATMSVGPQFDTVARAAADEGRSVAAFLMMRQAGLADAALVCVLLMMVVDESRQRRTLRLEPFRVPQNLRAYQKRMKGVAGADVTATTTH